MSKAIELTRELMEVLFQMGFWVEHKNKKSFIVVSQSELMCDAFSISKILNEHINTYNVNNIAIGNNTLQDLFTFEISIKDCETIIIDIFNLQSYKDKMKYKDFYC